MKFYPIDMKRLLLLVAILSCAALSYSQDQKSFKGLNQLRGLWKMESAKGAMYEEWSKSNNSLLSGKSYRLNEKDTLLLETVKLTNSKDGIYYTVIVSGEQPVAFKLIKSNNNTYTFENKMNEFPQRIIYELVSADSLHARIEGSYKGKETSSDFNFTRVK
jgi:hypothetical protein